MSKRQKRVICGVLTLFIIMCSSCSGNENGTEKTEITTTEETVTTAETTKEVTTTVITTTKETTTEETSSNEETTTEETTSEEEKKNVFCDELFVMPKDGIRPVAVLIDNEGSSVLPQGGPGLAQVVYEIIVEGGITRLMPVYWGLDIDYLGPVRSARHYMLDYMKETDAFFVHYGWSPQAKQDIADYGIQIANGVSNAYNIFWDLTKDKNNWQDTYTSSDRIKDFMIRNGYSTETKVRMSERYHEEWSIPTEGKDCSFLSIQYSSGYKIGYEFNPDNGLYKRTRQGKPHMERNNDLQIEAGNIIIMKVRNYTIKGDDAGRQHLETTGSGTGYYVTSGKIINIKWTKETRFAMTKFTDEKGEEIVLNPARTWIQVVPVEAIIDFE
jgi:hypothetical protein